MNLNSFPKINTLLFCFLCLIACSKSGSKKSKTELISSASWKFSQAGLDNNGDGTIDVAAPAGFVEACVTDNVVTFKSDKSGIVDEGATKCSSSDPQTSPFTWTLSSDESQITFSGALVAGIGGDAKIIEVSESRFVLSKALTISGFPLPVPVVVILVH
jgi:hypothetical protein